MGTELHQRDMTPWRTFTSDLRLALGAWLKAPALPLITAIFHLLNGLAFLLLAKRGSFFPFALVPMLFGTGWAGVERLWYLRVYRGEQLKLREAAWFTVRYIPSFLLLGVIVGIAMILPSLVIGLTLTGGTAFVVGNILLTIAFDVALTFVTPSLAFSDFMVTKAIRRGSEMLRTHWTHAKYYALVPPLAAVIGVQYLARELGVGWVVVLGLAAGLLNLWFKGATAAYYLRFNNVGRNGRFDSDIGAYIQK